MDNAGGEASTKKGTGYVVNAGSVSDLKPGSMKDFAVAETGMKILVSRTSDGNVYATGAKCT